MAEIPTVVAAERLVLVPELKEAPMRKAAAEKELATINQIQDAGAERTPPSSVELRGSTLF